MDRINKRYAVVCYDACDREHTIKTFTDYLRAVEHFKAKLGEELLSCIVSANKNAHNGAKVNDYMKEVYSSCWYFENYRGEHIEEIPNSENEFEIIGSYLEISCDTFHLCLETIEEVS